jgi:hypothetical protein
MSLTELPCTSTEVPMVRIGRAQDMVACTGAMVGSNEP